MAKPALKIDIPMEELTRHCEPHDEGFTITVKVKPNASKESLSINSKNEITLAVRAQAVEGAANERVIELLAHVWSVAKTRISILSGHHARVKRILVRSKPGM